MIKAVWDITNDLVNANSKSKRKSMAASSFLLHSLSDLILEGTEADPDQAVFVASRIEMLGKGLRLADVAYDFKEATKLIAERIRQQATKPLTRAELESFLEFAGNFQSLSEICRAYSIETEHVR